MLKKQEVLLVTSSHNSSKFKASTVTASRHTQKWTSKNSLILYRLKILMNLQLLQQHFKTMRSFMQLLDPNKGRALGAILMTYR